LDTAILLRRNGAADQNRIVIRHLRRWIGVMHVAADNARFAGTARATTAAEVRAQAMAFCQL
jgi:hypothetical protein